MALLVPISPSSASTPSWCSKTLGGFTKVSPLVIAAVSGTALQVWSSIASHREREVADANSTSIIIPPEKAANLEGLQNSFYISCAAALAGLVVVILSCVRHCMLTKELEQIKLTADKCKGAASQIGNVGGVYAAFPVTSDQFKKRKSSFFRHPVHDSLLGLYRVLEEKNPLPPRLGVN